MIRGKSSISGCFEIAFKNQEKINPVFGKLKTD